MVLAVAFFSESRQIVIGTRSFTLGAVRRLITKPVNSAAILRTNFAMFLLFCGRWQRLVENPKAQNTASAQDFLPFSGAPFLSSYLRTVFLSFSFNSSKNDSLPLFA